MARGERSRHRHRRADVLSTSSPAPFLGASIEKGIDAHPVPDEEDSTSPCTQLVAAERHNVSAFRDADPPRAGTGVDMHERADLMRSRDDRGDGLDRADLVVGEADG